MQKKLSKNIGLLDVFCISSGAMISSGLFILPALAYAKTGAGILFSYAIASLIILPTIFSKAELVTAMPKTGGIYFFTDRSMGPMMGTIGGLIDWVALTFKTAFSLLAMGIFVIIIKPDASEFTIKLIAICSCLFFTILNILGVKITSKAQNIIVLSLIAILIVYIILGLPNIDGAKLTPMLPDGIFPIFTTAGFIFISFAGTTKVAAIAGEVRNPSHILPQGMLLSWAIVSILYLLAILVTVGVSPPAMLANSLTPLSLGGDILYGKLGMIIMSIAALLAFISTGNAGTLAASRDPMAMSIDGLLPSGFKKISKQGTPWVSIIATSLLMITMLIFLDLENFAKTASALVLLLFIVANLAVVFMREGNIKHYHPRYKSPLYPWIQFAAIIIYGLLLIEMGSFPLMIVSFFILSTIIWYFIYVFGRIKREYALLNLIERITGIKNHDNLLDEELREIILERDDITKKRFMAQISVCPIIDLRNSVSSLEIFDIISFALAQQLGKSPNKLLNQLKRLEKKPEKRIDNGIAMFSLTIKGKNKFEIMVVRDLQGITFSNDKTTINAAFIIVHTADEWFYHLHALTWLAEIVKEKQFISRWKDAKSKSNLRDIILELPEVKKHIKIKTPNLGKLVFMTKERLRLKRKNPKHKD